jgi:hypothetical protein
MQWETTEIDECTNNNEAIIIQAQGDNTPTVFIFPYDISTIDFVGTIKFPAPIDLLVGSGITIIDAPNGQISIQLTSEQTQTVPEGQYPFDIWSKSLGGINTQVITGYYNINNTYTVIS